MSSINTFASDNISSACPEVMEALAKANEANSPSYGEDPWTRDLAVRLGEIFETPVTVFPVTTGTAANALALSTLTPAFGKIFCHELAHINTDECGAPELFTGGAKLIDMPGANGRITAQALEETIYGAGNVHHAQPASVSITQACESGTVYSIEEIEAIATVAHSHNLSMHMDGARFANALVTLGCSPAETTWKAGIDVLSFGGTKNGAWAAEAVVFFDPARAAEMKWRRKRAGQTLSKGRLIGAQFEGLLADGHWLDLARYAHALAQRLAQAIGRSTQARLAWPCQANEVFPILSPALQARLKAAGVGYLDWSARALPVGEALAEGEVVGRFVMSFATPEADVTRLIALIEAADG